MSTQEERRRRREAKANARLEQGSQDDQENKMQEQDPEARKVLRSKYRELKQSIAEDDEELGRLDSNRFHELVDKMDDLSKEVMKPREQIADAEAVANLASKLLGNVRGMIRRSGTSPSAFVTAILAKFGNRTAVDGEVVEVEWGELGLEAIGFMREAPGVCTMLGPMDIEPKVRQAQAPRAKRARPTETARAEEVRDQGEAAAKSETDANMEIMFNILRRHRPARLDALVLNRHSFSQTVENIFSLSFLVKDGRAAITYDSDGTHLVAPKNAPSVDARQSGQVSNTQFVFRYDFNCWKMMRDGLPEGDELMPNREQPQPSQPPTQPSGTPIRKNSRNRGRESSRVNGSDDHGNESGPEGDGRRQSKRARTLVDQFR